MYVNMHNVCARMQYSENNSDTVSVILSYTSGSIHYFKPGKEKETSTMLILLFISYFELAVSVNFLALT